MTHVGVKFVIDYDKKIKETGAKAAAVVVVVTSPVQAVGAAWVLNKLL